MLHSNLMVVQLLNAACHAYMLFSSGVQLFNAVVPVCLLACTCSPGHHAGRESWLSAARALSQHARMTGSWDDRTLAGDQQVHQASMLIVVAAQALHGCEGCLAQLLRQL